MLLVGPESSGKSHLAAIWAAAAGARFISASVLAETDPPAALATGALVIEDLSEGEVGEHALFHLLNLAREEDAFVLLTARRTPAAWNVGLPDLASRLRALPVVTLASPDDALLRAVIAKLAADRQLTLDETVIGFLLTRIERSVAAARDAVTVLDREALRQKRPVTRALAADIFRDLGA
jgi:chromosomal replication initiation ATPase DnaA